MPSAPQYTAELAAFVSNVMIDTIPPSFLDLLRTLMLDVFSAVLAGSIQPVYRSAAKVLYGSGSDSTAIVAVNGTTISLSGAMLVNGIAAGDFEVEHVISDAHPASAVFPVL